MNTRTLKIVHIFPPIPCRKFDFTVYDDDEAENPRIVGFGATEWEALDDYANELRAFTEQMEAEALLTHQGKDKDD